MKKLLSVLVLGLTLLLTGCSDKPGEQFVGKWQNPNARYQYEIKRNGDSKDSFAVKTRDTTLEGRLLDDTLIVNGIIQLTIDPATGEMIDNNVGTTIRFKKAE